MPLPKHKYKLTVDTYPKPPSTRGECLESVRPCPHFTCKYHLGSEVTISGNLKVREIKDEDETCCLDVAAAGEHTEEEVGKALGITKQAVDLALRSAFRKLKGEMRDYAYTK